MPALRTRFRVEAAAARREALDNVKEDLQSRRDLAKENGESLSAQDFGGHHFERTWATSGQSTRLLSLLGSTSIYTGGAHPNSGTAALLWDRLRGRQVTTQSLLRPGQSWTGAIRQPFCTLLDRERAERRGQRIVRGEWPNQCPALSELTLALSDRNGNGRFDHVAMIADAYVAGSYAEGAYEVTLPLTTSMLARLRPEYRTSFEPQPPVQ